MLDDKSNVNWQSVSSDEDLASLLHEFGGFHDACLREIHVATDHYVTDALKMNVVGNLDTSAALIFQRQFRNPSAIEMRFTELTRLVLAPTAKGQDSIILSADLKRTDQDHFMLHVDMRKPSPVAGVRSELLVVGQGLAWREVDWLGPSLRYGNSVESPGVD
jgi:hypothetical protein